jgi:hypothetical protein
LDKHCSGGTAAMKSISIIIAGAQALLGINFELQSCFEESLADDKKHFSRQYGQLKK